MKKAGLAVMLLGCALCFAGCGFTEGTDAVVTVVKATPTPEPTPTPLPTPTPEPTPTPVVVTEQTPGGLSVTVKSAQYTATEDVNLRKDANTDSDIVKGITKDTVLDSTGVVENGWIRVTYEGQECYVSGDYVAMLPGSEGVPAEGADTLTSEVPADGTVAPTPTIAG